MPIYERDMGQAAASLSHAHHRLYRHRTPINRRLQAYILNWVVAADLLPVPVDIQLVAVDFRQLRTMASATVEQTNWFLNNEVLPE